MAFLTLASSNKFKTPKKLVFNVSIGYFRYLGGEAGQASANSGNGPAQTAFNALRLIVTIGWAIYPIGYAVGYFGGGIDAGSLNVIYNFADFVNKIAFGLIIYVAATADSNA